MFCLLKKKVNCSNINLNKIKTSPQINNWNEMTIENVINNNRQQRTASFKMVNMVV